MIKRFAICMAILLFCIGLIAQTQELIWTAQLPSQIRGIDTNSQGYVVSFGAFEASGPQLLGYNTISVHDSAGTFLWSYRVGFEWGGASAEPGITSICINESNEVYFYTKYNHYVDNGYYNLYTWPSQYPGISKLSSTGELLWYKYVWGVGSLSLDTNSSSLVVTLNGLFGPATCGSTLPSVPVPVQGWDYTTPYYVAIVVFDNAGNRTSYKILNSNWMVGFSTVYLEGNDLYISGSYHKSSGVYSPPVVLYFENTIGGDTTVSHLPEAPNRAYLAKLNLVTNNWSWYKNITLLASQVCKVADNIFLSQGYAGDVHKYSASSGDLLNTANFEGLQILHLYSCIDAKIHFIAQYLNTQNQMILAYGNISPNLTLLEQYPAPFTYTYQGFGSDSFGNKYLPWVNRDYPPNEGGQQRSIGYLAKIGFAGAYMLPDQEGTISFGTGYPNVEYQRSINITNIGNAPLSITGLLLANSSVGLTASVNGDSTASSGNTSQVMLNFSPLSAFALSDTLIVMNNSVNEPSFKIAIRGIVEEAPPISPTSIAIDVIGSSVRLSWLPVQQSIVDTPVFCDTYLVMASQNSMSDDDFVLLWVVSDTTFVHPNITRFRNKMFYSVISVAGSGSDFRNNKINSLRGLGVMNNDIYEDFNLPEDQGQFIGIIRLSDIEKVLSIN